MKFPATKTWITPYVASIVPDYSHVHCPGVNLEAESCSSLITRKKNVWIYDHHAKR